MEFKHKGYTLKQAEHHHHYMIYADDGQRVMHVPHDKPLTEDEAIERIEGYILLTQNMEEYLDEVLGGQSETRQA